mgnify:CR=1 FL=1
MKAYRLIIFILFFVCIANHFSFAQQTTTAEHSNSEELVTDLSSPSSIRDTITIGDSIVVIHTVCAPICSSHVRVYNKEWQQIGTLEAPFKSIFPEAYIEDNRILWRDNDTFDYTPSPY